MKLLDRLLRYSITLFLVLLVLSIGVLILGIDINFALADIFKLNLISIILLVSFLSINIIYNKYKFNPDEGLKALIERLLLVFALVSVGNILKSRGINIRLDFIFTIFFALLSYYIEESELIVYLKEKAR